MLIKTALTSSELKQAQKEGLDFIVYKGKIYSQETFKGFDVPWDEKDPPEKVSETEEFISDMSLAKAFEEDGQDPKKADAVLIKCTYLCSDDESVAGRCWIDKSEYRKQLEANRNPSDEDEDADEPKQVVKAIEPAGAIKQAQQKPAVKPASGDAPRA